MLRLSSDIYSLYASRKLMTRPGTSLPFLPLPVRPEIRKNDKSDVTPRFKALGMLVCLVVLKIRFSGFLGEPDPEKRENSCDPSF